MLTLPPVKLPRVLSTEFLRELDLLEGDEAMPLRKDVAGDPTVGVRRTDSATEKAKSLLSEEERMRTGPGQVMESGRLVPLRMERGDGGGERSGEEMPPCPSALEEKKGELEGSRELSTPPDEGGTGRS
jgi:hypothetical protein